MSKSDRLPAIPRLTQHGFHVRTLRCLAAGLFVVYLGWNVYWLTQGSVPPSLFKSLTGLPCPTTGGTRSIYALCNGQLRLSLNYNPMTLPIVALFLASAIWPAILWVRGKRPAISRWMVYCWLVVLASAWLAKMLGSPQYW